MCYSLKMCLFLLTKQFHEGKTSVILAAAPANDMRMYICYFLVLEVVINV